MPFARLGWYALLSLTCLPACTQGDDEAAPMGINQGGDSASGGSSGSSGQGGSSGVTSSPMDGGGGEAGMSSGDSGAADARVDAGDPPDSGSAPSCAPRVVKGTPEVNFPHVHFNTADPEEDLIFFEKFFNAPGDVL